METTKKQPTATITEKEYLDRAKDLLNEIRNMADSHPEWGMFAYICTSDEQGSVAAIKGSDFEKAIYRAAQLREGLAYAAIKAAIRIIQNAKTEK